MIIKNKELFFDVLKNLNQIISWFVEHENTVLQEGRELNYEEKKFAKLIGISEIDKVRIKVIDNIRIPYEKLDFNTPYGLTVGYGIYIQKESIIEKLIKHELVHVSQYEKYGSHKNFISQYVKEYLEYGYLNMPLEMEARKISSQYTVVL